MEILVERKQKNKSLYVVPRGRSDLKLYVDTTARDPFFSKVEKKFVAPPKSITNDVYLTPIEENLH